MALRYFLWITKNIFDLNKTTKNRNKSTFTLKNTTPKPVFFGNYSKFSTKITHSKCAHSVGTPSAI